MQKIRASKGNWTGEWCEIVIQDDGTFTIGMFYNRDELFVFTMGEYGDVYIVTCEQEPSWKWKGYGFQVRGMDWTSFQGGGVERENKNPYIAFAQVAWSTI